MADAAGLKIRGGSREMDQMFKAAGAASMTMPSNELYISMQTGAVDAAVTSSTSMISFKMDREALERWREVARASAWKDFAERSTSCERLLRLAEGVVA